jgi:4-aminobutyrate aminotransferase-like enzyme/Ser/Thr protein kinase RdoA (MazF antagonist)
MTTVATAPRFSVEDGRRLGREFFGIEAEGEVCPLPSERDQNFLLRLESGDAFVLKIANASERRERLEFQNDVMGRLNRDPGGPLCPRPVAGPGGEQIFSVTHPAGRSHFVRCVSYLPGTPLGGVRPHDGTLLCDLGAFTARLVKALSAIEGPDPQPDLIWNVRNGPRVIAEYGGDIDDPEKRRILRTVFRLFEHHADSIKRLPDVLAHNDGNDWNIIIAPPERTVRAFGRMSVAGIIDFGDMTRSPSLTDLAVVLAYAMLGKGDPLAAAVSVIKGYHAVLPLAQEDAEALFGLVCLRLCMSAAIAARQKALDPKNDYLSISEAQVGMLLEEMARMPASLPGCVFRAACGHAPVAGAETALRWISEKGTHGEFADVLGFALTPENTVPLDLSVGSPLFEREEHWTDMAAFASLVDFEMAASGARVGVGRYGEARLLYTSPVFKSPENPLADGRTIHFGVDLFVPAGTPVHAPLDGIVHSFRDNAADLDYGPTVILEHSPEPGVRFFTLYGHLSRESLQGLAPGRAVGRGERIAAVGGRNENGGWPPHLHFQIMTEMLGLEGDFPGVAPASWRRFWMTIVPDPSLILGLSEESVRPPGRPPEELAALRQRLLGPSLSLSYRVPLKIVRGDGRYLFDHEGRVFLDAVNNVPHVGHCHPRVVEAVRRQAAVLNTNTRYLHDLILEYAERLTALLPEPLQVCFFVNSGSEANDLALRMARTFTGRRDVIVIDGAYHGNLSSLIDISPYKFDGPGGAGRPHETRKVPMPDPYRGLYRDDPWAGSRYAVHIGEVIAELAESGRKPAAFIAEPVLSCGGQIVPPPGFLEEAFRRVRSVKGVCIADEVQTGFGRCGTHFWAFETQDVRPDIVTLGKPIGNGHPLGAVITTREIADAFATGMEYFNTFGGNPVSCAAGLAVLDVIRDEKLQENALKTGGRLRDNLQRLQGKHDLIGDVRGLGLFLGLEFVLDRETRTPAPLHAAYIVERMRGEGILLSTDGPDRNVIKIKPPLVFTAADADLLADRLDAILSETPLCRDRDEGMRT